MLVQFFDRLSAAQPDANRSLRKTLRILRIEMEIGPWAPGVGTVVVLSVPYWNIEKDLFSSSVSTRSISTIQFRRKEARSAGQSKNTCF